MVCLRDREADRPARGSEDSLGQELLSGLRPPLLLPHLRACTTTRPRCPVWGREPCSWRRPTGGVGAGGRSGTCFVPRQGREEGSPAPDRLTCRAPFTAQLLGLVSRTSMDLPSYQGHTRIERRLSSPRVPANSCGHHNQAGAQGQGHHICQGTSRVWAVVGTSGCPIHI